MREEKGCVDTLRLRERGEYVRPPSVISPPHRRPAFRTHNLGMSADERVDLADLLLFC